MAGPLYLKYTEIFIVILCAPKNWLLLRPRGKVHSTTLLKVLGLPVYYIFTGVTSFSMSIVQGKLYWLQSSFLITETITCYHSGIPVNRVFHLKLTTLTDTRHHKSTLQVRKRLPISRAKRTTWRHDAVSQNHVTGHVTNNRAPQPQCFKSYRCNLNITLRCYDV